VYWLNFIFNNKPILTQQLKSCQWEKEILCKSQLFVRGVLCIMAHCLYSDMIAWGNDEFKKKPDAANVLKNNAEQDSQLPIGHQEVTGSLRNWLLDNRLYCSCYIVIGPIRSFKK
jgi:hypothetical protein